MAQPNNINQDNKLDCLHANNLTQDINLSPQVYTLELQVLQRELSHLPHDYKDPSSKQYYIYAMHRTASIAAQKIYDLGLESSDLAGRGGCDEYWKIIFHLNNRINELSGARRISQYDNKPLPDSIELNNTSFTFISIYLSGLYYLIWNYSQDLHRQILFYKILVYPEYINPKLEMINDNHSLYFATIPMDITQFYILPLLHSSIHHLLHEKFVPYRDNNRPYPLIIHRKKTKYCKCTDHPSIFIVYHDHISTYCGISLKIYGMRPPYMGVDEFVISTDGFIIEFVKSGPKNKRLRGDLTAEYNAQHRFFIKQTCIFTGNYIKTKPSSLLKSLPDYASKNDSYCHDMSLLQYVTHTDYYPTFIYGNRTDQRINRDPSLKLAPKHLQGSDIYYDFGNHVVTVIRPKTMMQICIDGRNFMEISSICVPVKIHNCLYVLNSDGIFVISFDFLVSQ